MLVPLIKFQYMDDVRTAAMMAMPELLQASVLALKTGVPEASEAFVHQLKEFMYTPMVDQARILLYYGSKLLSKIIARLNHIPVTWASQLRKDPN